MTTSDRLVALSTIVAGGAAVAGLIFAVVQIRAAKIRAAVSRTYALQERDASMEMIRAKIAASAVLQQCTVGLVFGVVPIQVFESLKTDPDKREKRAMVLFLLNLFEEVAETYLDGLLHPRLSRATFSRGMARYRREWSWFIDHCYETDKRAGLPEKERRFRAIRHVSEIWSSRDAPSFVVLDAMAGYHHS